MISRATARRKTIRRPSMGSMPRGIAGRAILALVKRQRVNLTSAGIGGPEVRCIWPEGGCSRCSRWSSCSEP
jgi:hypothetical protein